MTPKWNKIAFDRWEDGGLAVEVNEFDDVPIWIEVDGYDQIVNFAMTPARARAVAVQLIDAANAAEKAGLVLEG